VCRAFEFVWYTFIFNACMPPGCHVGCRGFKALLGDLFPGVKITDTRVSAPERGSLALRAQLETVLPVLVSASLEPSRFSAPERGSLIL
jgi:hypothetical protein